MLAVVEYVYTSFILCWPLLSMSILVSYYVGRCYVYTSFILCWPLLSMSILVSYYVGRC